MRGSERPARMEATMYGTRGNMLETTQFGGWFHPYFDGTLCFRAPRDLPSVTDMALPQDPPQSSGPSPQDYQ